jgi:hypothetical protein
MYVFNVVICREKLLIWQPIEVVFGMFTYSSREIDCSVWSMVLCQTLWYLCLYVLKNDFFHLFTGLISVHSWFFLNCCHWLCIDTCSKMEEQRQVYLFCIWWFVYPYAGLYQVFALCRKSVDHLCVYCKIKRTYAGEIFWIALNSF